MIFLILFSVPNQTCAFDYKADSKQRKKQGRPQPRTQEQARLRMRRWRLGLGQQLGRLKEKEGSKGDFKGKIHGYFQEESFRQLKKWVYMFGFAWFED
ncbi:hypothetical protein CRYUN_Cryun08bG0100100 [Craigia yunnanensis]